MCKRNSLYFQLVVLLLISAIASVLVFTLLNNMGGYVIGRYYLNSEYIEHQNEKYITKLQNYIYKSQLESKDVNALDSWIKDQKIISIEVYQNNILVYNSENAYKGEQIEEQVEAPYYEWKNYYKVQFLDGDSEVSIYGVYDYQIYNNVMVLELIISFILFLFMVVLGIRKKINYVMQLKNEIEMLESGNLDYKITVTGKDELAMLANGLDYMRQSFYDQVQQEAQMVKENQRIITEMSHDLRTPITSIMLYAEILKKSKNNSQNQLDDYINKIEKKAGQMKQLTDHLFEYSLVTGEHEIEMDAPEEMSNLFYDLFSEICSYLEQKGFTVDFSVMWNKKKIQINMDYVTRIMDNILSNIYKYADHAHRIIIVSAHEEGCVGFEFINKRKMDIDQEKSTGIGIQSIQNMMKKMNGKCITNQNNDDFSITILFPYHKL